MAIERFRPVEEPPLSEEGALRMQGGISSRAASGFDDPLAELARIIGGDDPYRRDLQRAARNEPVLPPMAEVEPAPLSYPDADPDPEPVPVPEPAHHDAGWDDLEAELASFSVRQQAAPAADEPVLDLDMRWLRQNEPEFPAVAPPALHFDPPVAEAPRVEPASSESFYAEPFPVHEPVQQAYPSFEAEHDTWHAAPEPEEAHAASAPPAAWTDGPDFASEPYDQRAFYQEDAAGVSAAPLADEPPYEAYDSLPRRRSAGLLTIGVVLALTAFGGAGYAGYKVLKSGSSSGEVKLVKADPEPAKIAGPAAVENAKRVQDRVPSGPEQVVSREEKPLSMREQSAQIQAPPQPQGPRVIPISPAGDGEPQDNAAKPDAAPVQAQAPAPAPPVPAIPPLPPLPASVAPAAPAVAAPQAVAAAPFSSAPSPVSRPAAADEPRRVKTVSIGPDGKERNAPSTAPGPSLLAPPAQMKPVSSAPAQPKRMASPPANGPIQLAPTAVANARPAPQNVAPAASGEGDFMLQLASDKTEEGARAAYSGLKRKYSALGPYSASFKSVDLGDKGTYVRARIGPFTHEAAEKVCGELRAQGGVCLIQRR